MSRAPLRIAFTFLAGCVILAGCGAPPAITDENAAKFDFAIAKADFGYIMTARQLYEYLKKSDVQPTGGYVPDTIIQAYLDSLVADTLMGFEADGVNIRNFYGDWWTYRLRHDDVMLQAYLQSTVYSKVSADSSEVLVFFKSRPDLFHVEDQVELYHILISPIGLKFGHDSLYYRSLGNDEFDAELKQYAFDIYDLLSFGQKFQDVATKYSHDDGSRMKGGYQGWVGRNIYLPPFDSVAFTLKPGEFSKPYRDKDGWHILYITDRVVEGFPPIDRAEVYASAKQSLLTSKANEIGRGLLDSLHRETSVIVNPVVLDTNIFKVEDSVWAGIVNKTDTFDCKYLKNLEQGYRQKYKVASITPDIRKEMVAYLGDRFTMLKAARQLRVDTFPQTHSQLSAIQHETARSILERSQFNSMWEPPDTSVKEYYNSHRQQFLIDKPLVVQQIVCSDSVFAEYLRDQADAGTDFMELAKQYYPGEPSVRIHLADLGAIGPKDVDQEFYTIALATPVGQVSRPVKTRYGYQIIKVLKHEESRGPEQARGEIQTILTAEHKIAEIRAFRDNLYKKYHAQFPGQLRSAHLKPYADRRK